MMKRMFLVLMTLTLVAPQVGCATGKSPGRAIADTVLPVSQENELGKQMSAEVEKELKISDNAAINGWVEGLGKKVVRAARDVPPGIKFTFKVVDDPNTVNAFAMPGGYIYIYTGLLKKASNEAEIVGVLGHEVAHVTQRHIAKRLVASYGLSAIASVALGQNASLLSELVAGVVANGYLLKHSRDAERESDKIGLGYTVQSGYTPMGYVTFFKKLAEEPRPPAILSSHPDPNERVKNARQLITTYSKSVLNQTDGKAKYNEMIQKL